MLTNSSLSPTGHLLLTVFDLLNLSLNHPPHSSTQLLPNFLHHDWFAAIPVHAIPRLILTKGMLDVNPRYLLFEPTELAIFRQNFPPRNPRYFNFPCNPPVGECQPDPLRWEGGSKIILVWKGRRSFAFELPKMHSDIGFPLFVWCAHSPAESGGFGGLGKV